MKGAELNKWRRDAGLSQSRLAVELGVAANTVARWERDEMAIPPFLPLALAEIRRRIKAEAAKREPGHEYLKRVLNEKKLTFRTVSARAQKQGFELSQTYIVNLVQGVNINPSTRSLQALAAGLGEPEDEVFAAFRMSVTRNGTKPKPKK